MITNTAPNGTRYGYIAANSLDDDVVHELMCGAGGKDLGYEEAWGAFNSELRSLLDEEDINDETQRQVFNDGYQCDEPIVEGTYEGVKYRSSWLGGALHFFIFESPHVGYFMPCSPCVPGAADLQTKADPNNLGQVITSVQGYDVPPDWRWKESA